MYIQSPQILVQRWKGSIFWCVHENTPSLVLARQLALPRQYNVGEFATAAKASPTHTYIHENITLLRALSLHVVRSLACSLCMMVTFMLRGVCCTLGICTFIYIYIFGSEAFAIATTQRRKVSIRCGEKEVLRTQATTNMYKYGNVCTNTIQVFFD